MTSTEPSPARWQATVVARPMIPPPTTSTSGRRFRSSGMPGSSAPRSSWVSWSGQYRASFIGSSATRPWLRPDAYGPGDGGHHHRSPSLSSTGWIPACAPHLCWALVLPASVRLIAEELEAEPEDAGQDQEDDHELDWAVNVGEPATAAAAGKHPSAPD